MLRRFRAPLAAALFCAVLAPATATAQQAGEEYAVVPNGSAVGFTVVAKMLFRMKQEGRFKDFSGQVSYDPARPADTRLSLTVYTGSVDMHDPDHDQLMKSSSFFDVDRFPTMNFVSTGAEPRPDGTLAVTGDLTIRGITKRIVVPVNVHPGAHGSPAAALDTTFEVDRTEFGLNGVSSWKGLNVSVAKNVQIHVSIAAARSTLRIGQ